MMVDAGEVARKKTSITVGYLNTEQLQQSVHQKN